ncbi:MAG: GUN4 domain-containing protein [Microcoleus sp.]
MSYCVNPACPAPQNPDTLRYCQACGSGLLLHYNRYRSIKMIGQGGFGRTFLAVDDNSLGKLFRVIKQFYPQDPTTIQRNRINVSNPTIAGSKAIEQLPDIFRQEIERLEQLGSHPQIPALVDSFEQDGFLYLVQEFFEGDNLATELNQQGAFGEVKILQLLADLLPILKFIHDNHVIHRDIKPDNILRQKSNQKLVLVDFGVSKLVTKRVHTNNFATANIGTIGYIAPEQSMGIQSFASDFYSLGVTCICLMTKKTPSELFNSGTHSWDWRHYLIGEVSEGLSKILDKLLQPAVNNRYQSASEVLKDITELSSPIKQQHPKKKITAWEKAGILAAVIAALTGVVALFKPDGSKATADAVDQVKIVSSQDLSYSQLVNYLRDKNWKAADRETYEIMLKSGGKVSEARGYIDQSQVPNLSCTDLQTIDRLWRAASEGKLGFSAQQLIYEHQGLNWQKMYAEVGWGSLKGTVFTKTVDREFDLPTRRLKYKSGMEPDFQNPSPGHLPVTIGLVKGKALPQFADVCKF